MKDSDLSFIILALVQLKGIGAAFIKKNLATIQHSHHWSSTNAEASLTMLLALVGKKYSHLDIREAIFKAEDIVAECESNQVSFLSIAQKEYPGSLFDLKDPPPILFFLGNLSLLNQGIVTIIGTRKPNDNAKIIATRISKHFVSKDWVICNGLADGIDTFSILDQEASCFAKVVGVVGSGLSRPAFRSLPKQAISNIDLVLRHGGLVLSEMPPSKKQDTFSVIKSCRIQAGIGKGLILVQSSLNGGSKFAVKAAVDSSRPLGIVYPVKGDIHREDYAANRKIIEGGIRGLGEFVELRNGKNSNPKIVVLSSRDSYPEFESTLKRSNQALVFSV